MTENKLFYSLVVDERLIVASSLNKLNNVYDTTAKKVVYEFIRFSNKHNRLFKCEVKDLDSSLLSSML